MKILLLLLAFGTVRVSPAHAITAPVKPELSPRLAAVQPFALVKSKQAVPGEACGMVCNARYPDSDGEYRLCLRACSGGI